MALGPSTATPALNENVRKLQDKLGELFGNAAGNAEGAAATILQQATAYAPVILGAIERFRRPVQDRVEQARAAVQAAPRGGMRVGIKWPIIAVVVTGAAAYVMGRMANRSTAAASRRARRTANVA